jgi:Tol biopolymer transport system component
MPARRFNSSPFWQPDAHSLAWVSEPSHMPRTVPICACKAGNSRLKQNTLASILDITTVAGYEQTAIFHRSFHRMDTTCILSDSSGWWQIYLYDLNSGTQRQLT